MRWWILYKRSVQQLCWTKGELNAFKKSIVLPERYVTRAVLRFLVKNLQACKSVHSKLFFLWSIPPLYFCKYAFRQSPFFDCFMNKEIYSEIINACLHSGWEVLSTSKTTFTYFSSQGLCRNPPLKHSLSQSLISDFSASIINAEKISDLVAHFVPPHTWMCERKHFKITNLYRNWTCSKLMQRWRASTSILN